MDTLTQNDSILYSENGTVGTLTFNRPDALNTFRAQDYIRLQTILEAVAVARHVRVLVITGKGKAFSAGQDLSELNMDTIADPSYQKEQLHRLQSLTRLVASLRIPTVAAFNGFAVGFGLELALACDFRIATHDCYFMFPEAARGLLHTNGVLWLLPRLIGLAASKEMLLSGSKFSAQYALEKGLISAVYTNRELVNETEQLAKRLGNNSPKSIGMTKDVLAKTYDATFEEVLNMEVSGFLDIIQTVDFKEGVASFLEKRAPKF